MRSVPLFPSVGSCVAALVLACTCVTVAHADPLFDDHAILELKITAPLKDLMRGRKRAGRETAGSLTLDDGTALDVKFTPRGKSRLKHCSFTPLWLDLKKGQVQDTVFAGQNKLKLVTHCKPAMAQRGYVETEYLAYRIYNVISDVSFRVRRVEVTYFEPNSENARGPFPGFLIEHKKRLSKRLSGEVVEPERVKRKDYDPLAFARATLFQYAIGNPDFSFLQGPDVCCHNAIVFQGQDGVLSPIPYDFDSTGLVNPPYAAPAQGLGIKRVTQRIYRGFCTHNEALQTSRQEFLTHQSEIEALLNSDEMRGYRVKPVQRYLAAFFEVLQNDKAFNSRLLKRCR